MKLLFLLIIPALIYAESLKSLIEFAMQNNARIHFESLTHQAKAYEAEAQKRSYYPTIDAGGFYQTLNERTPMQPGDLYSAYAKIGFDIYDGGKKESLINQKEYELQASGFDEAAAKRSLSLQIAKQFFSLKSLQASMASLQEESRSLEAQLQRVHAFFKAKMATQDDLDRMQSAYDTNLYTIASLEYQIQSAQHTLALYVGKEVQSLDASHFNAPLQNDAAQEIDLIESLIAQKEALSYSAQSLNSVYRPNLRIEDTYSFYDYGRSDPLHPEGVEQQNKLMLTLNLRLFDNNAVEKSKEAIMQHAKALQQQIAYLKEEQQMQYTLARQAITIEKVKIKSAASALNAAKSAFATINEKQRAGLVDNIVFLDALSTRTQADARYQTSLYDLESAYATYYYHAGKNIEEFLQ